MFTCSALQAKEDKNKNKQAEQVSSVRNEEEIKQIASRTSYAVYMAYRYDIAREIQTILANARLGNPHAVVTNHVLQYVRIFVDELAPIARQLKPEERKIFWDYVQKDLNSTFFSLLRNYCPEARVTREVASQVGLKRMHDF